MNFCILGAGAWGTAMAVHLHRLGHNVTLVPRRFEQSLELASDRENKTYLPGIELPRSLQIGHEIKPCLMEAEVVLFASPTAGLRDWSTQVKKHLAGAAKLQSGISLAKGMETGTLLRPTEIVKEILPSLAHGSLTGPTNALEVAQGRPTAMVLAGPSALDAVQEAVSGPSMRVYLSRDLVGVELGAGLKNIYAIAAGCSDGLSLGDNARAALLTRALAEMVRLGQAFGARAETFYGLSGFGDLVATCHGPWSRNRSFGCEIGRGQAIDELLGQRKTVVEGYRATAAFHDACQKRDLYAPILNEVYRLLYEKKSPLAVLDDLMQRDLKEEIPAE